MQLTWLSVLPPLIVIGAMMVIRHLNISLMVGILSAALIATHGHIFPALHLCAGKLIEHFSDADIIFLYIFLIIISSLIILLTITGSAAGCARIIGKKMKTARGGEISTIMLAFLLSIDDYLSILTVGLVASSIADRLAIVRTKLAYIIHALASPLVIIVPISTWAAAVLSQLDAAGVNVGETSRILADPFYVYLKTIPFVFYSVFTVLSVCFVVITRLGYGSVGKAEQGASIAVHNPGDEVESVDTNHSLIELFLPIGLLMVGVFVGILYAGDSRLFGGSHSLMDAFRNHDKTFVILCISSVVAFVSSFALSLYKKIITVRQLPMVLGDGFELIRSSIVMVVLASLLGSFLRIDLETGRYVAHILLDKTTLSCIPILFFLTSVSVTLMTGSAWGTFAILIPIATQMLVSFLHLTPPVSLDHIIILFPVLGAILSGAACGNHLSPFAETTIMTAASTGVNPLEHAKTQFVYAVPVIIGTMVSFTLVGLLINEGLMKSLLVSGGAGIIATIGLFLGFSWVKKSGD